MSDFETWWQQEGQEFLFALNTTTDDDIKLVAEFAWKNGAYCAEQAEHEPMTDTELINSHCRYTTPLMYEAAPVQRFTSDDVKVAFENGYAAGVSAVGIAKEAAEPVDGVLPCPFCGDNKPTVFEGSTFRWRVAVCNNCGAYAPEVRHDTLAEDQKQAGIESDAAAITAWNTRAAPVQQAEQEPVAYLCPSFVDNFATGRYETCEQKDYGAFPVYAAPVRTKNLTDDEIKKLQHKIDWTAEWSYVNFARDVIAADREKNKC